MKRLLGIGLIIGTVVMLAGCAGANAQSATTKAAAATQNTATVQRGNLTATVNAAGNISAHQQVALNFGQAGTVQKVNVRAGDRVKAGQVLTELDTSDLQLQLENAKVNLKIAQNKLAQTKAPSTEQDIANARSRLESAQASYNKLSGGPTKTDLAASQAALASAQAAYDAAVKSAAASGSTIDAATAQYQKSLAALQAAQAAYDKVATAPNIGARAESTAPPERNDRLQSGQSQLRGIAGDFGLGCQIEGCAGALVASAGAGEPGEAASQRQRPDLLEGPGEPGEKRPG